MYGMRFTKFGCQGPGDPFKYHVISFCSSVYFTATPGLQSELTWGSRYFNWFYILAWLWKLVENKGLGSLYAV